MARSSWSWVAGPVAALTGSLDRRAAWPPRVRWPGRLTLAVARRAAWTACRRPGPGGAAAHRGRRRLAACPGTRPAAPGISRRRGSGPDALAARSPGSPRPGHPDVGVVRVAVTCAFTAMARSGCRPGTGGAARDRPARSCGDGPSGLGPVRHRLMSGCAVTGAGLSGARFPWLPGARDLTGWPRGSRHGQAEWLAGRPVWPLRAAVSPHRLSEPCPDFFEFYRSSWSPVTESNRRPSPYHVPPSGPAAAPALPQQHGRGPHLAKRLLNQPPLGFEASR